MYPSAHPSLHPSITPPFLYPSSHPSRVSVIEPGPVRTQFERKVYDEGVKMDLSKADEVTADMFNVYLKNFKEIFETLGQTAEEIAEVERGGSYYLIDRSSQNIIRGGIKTEQNRKTGVSN